MGHISGNRLVEIGVEHMQAITVVVFLGSPCKIHLVVSDIGYMEINWGQTRHVAGIEGAGDPVGDTGAVAVLAHLIDVVGHGIEGMDGVEGVGDTEVAGSPAGGICGAIAYLIEVGGVAPT